MVSGLPRKPILRASTRAFRMLSIFAFLLGLRWLMTVLPVILVFVDSIFVFEYRVVLTVPKKRFSLAFVYSSQDFISFFAS